ncbi:hypothetical protein PIB30_114475, partial [Stylosanthes scabra]|nr:hypothetical protein [Stylosanthes scabra]
SNGCDRKRQEQAKKKRKVGDTKKGVPPSKVIQRKRSPRPKKKLKGKKVMEDKKKQSGMPSCKGSGGASSSKGTPQDTSDSESDEQGGNWSRPKPKVYMPQFLPSDDDYAYEYEEENLCTPVSSEDEYQKPHMKVHPHMNKKEAIAFLKEEFNVTAHEKMTYRA